MYSAWSLAVEKNMKKGMPAVHQPVGASGLSCISQVWQYPGLLTDTFQLVVVDTQLRRRGNLPAYLSGLTRVFESGGLLASGEIGRIFDRTFTK